MEPSSRRLSAKALPLQSGREQLGEEGFHIKKTCLEQLGEEVAPATLRMPV